MRRLILSMMLVTGCFGAGGSRPATCGSKPTATLVVAVQTEAGKPVKNIGVRILSGAGKPSRGVSDDRGEVRFTSEAGTLQVIVDDPSHPPTTTYAQLKAGDTQREVLTLLDGTAVTGTVVDGGGRPVAGAEISILGYGMVLPPDTTTDASGHFSSMLATGSWRMKAAKAGKSDTWATLDIAGAQTAAAVTITMPDAASLVVETDCKSKGCLGASVTVLVANGGYSRYLDASGASTFDNLPIGDAVVSVRDDKAPRYPIYGEGRVTLAPGGGTRASVTTAALDASASISGALVDAAGKQATTQDGSQLVVDVHFSGFGRRAIAAADGTFTVANVVPGECVVSGLRIDPKDPMSGANGMRATTKVVAPASGVMVKVNDFVRN